MNDTSMVTMSKTPRVGRKRVGRQRARVRPLEHDDARVGAQPPVELAVADVERDDARAPRRSRTSVKPPVEAPMSSAEPALDVDAEDVAARAPA